MGFLVSNCEDCIHKCVCGVKSKYDEFVDKVEVLKGYADDSINFDIVAECKHCKVEVKE